MGTFLTLAQVSALAARARPRKGGVALVLTAQDVAVEGFCTSQCGLHGSGADAKSGAASAYVWVGNSAAQCPGLCAWPFYQLEYGPQTPPLVPPNGDPSTSACYNANGAHLPALYNPSTSACSTLV